MPGKPRRRRGAALRPAGRLGGLLLAIGALLGAGAVASVFVCSFRPTVRPQRGAAAPLRSPAGALAAAAVSSEAEGAAGSIAFRRFFADASGQRVSPWHDIPLHTDVPEEKWMVTEIPKMTRAKMEIATKEVSNPIAQDLKKGRVREYPGPIYWNYGCFPQTWENPAVKHPQLGVFGDNDPLDVVEIGSRAHAEGEVRRVRVLGALAMIDSGELDWKVIAVDVEDPLAPELHSIADVEALMPGVVSGVREWFRWYKTPDGKPLNAFGFEEQALEASAALEVLAETHEAWRELRSGAGSHGLWVGQ